MLPVSHAAQASKATRTHVAQEGDAPPDQGFKALFAQGMAQSTPTASASAGASHPAISDANATAGATPRGSDSSVRPTDSRAAQGDKDVAGSPDAASATTDATAAGTSALKPKTDRAAKSLDPLADASAGAQTVPLQAGTILPTPRPAGVAAPIEAARGSVLARPGVQDVVATGVDKGAPVDMHGRAPAVRAQHAEGPGGRFTDALRDAKDNDGAPILQQVDSSTGLAAAGMRNDGTGAAPEAGALGAGLNALLERNARQFSATSTGGLSSGLLAAGPSAHGARPALGVMAGPDSTSMYAQMAQNLNAAPTFDTGLVPAGVVSLPLAAPLGDERWASALGQQALFMVGKQISSAQLTLNPPNLGPIQVTLDMQHDQASATFVSPHDAVRQAIEASLPHLRDAFAAAGLHLEQAQVQANAGSFSGGTSGQAFGQDSQARSGGTFATAAVTTLDGRPAPAGNVPSVQRRGLLDTFA